MIIQYTELHIVCFALLYHSFERCYMLSAYIFLQVFIPVYSGCSLLNTAL